MSSTSNNNPIEVSVLAAFGLENAYQSLKKHHREADLSDRRLLTQGNTPRFQAYGVKDDYSKNIAAKAGEPKSLSLTNDSTVAKLLISQKSFAALSPRNYIRKDFSRFLDEVSKTKGFEDGSVVHHVEHLFALLQYYLVLDEVPNPQAMPGENKGLSLTWQNATHQVEVNVRPNGLIDWFWASMISNDYEGHESTSISPKLVELFSRLKVVFSGA